MYNLLDKRDLFSVLLLSLVFSSQLQTTHVRKTKPIKKFKPWMTPHVRTKIRTRNRLAWTIHQNQQEWIDACCEARETVYEAKTESWKDLPEDAMSNSDCPNWKVIQGTPDASCPYEAMSHESRTITDIKFKTNVFISHYVKVRKLKKWRVDQDLNRKFKKRIKRPSDDDENFATLQMGELLSAIRKMKGKGADGPDNIPASFFKLLNPLILRELLSIFKSSFSLACCICISW